MSDGSHNWHHLCTFVAKCRQICQKARLRESIRLKKYIAIYLNLNIAIFKSEYCHIQI